MYLERIQTGRRFHLKVFLSQSSNRKGHVNAQIFEQATTVGAKYTSYLQIQVVDRIRSVKYR